MRLHEVKELGTRISTVRTDEQTEIGFYDPLVRGTPMRLYNDIMRTSLQIAFDGLVRNTGGPSKVDDDTLSSCETFLCCSNCCHGSVSILQIAGLAYEAGDSAVELQQ